MAAPDMDVIKDIPGYKVILKAVLKSQIQQLVEQLASTTDEESVILTASVADGTLSHLGSDSGKGFLEDHEDIKSQFLGFCLKKHHRKKQEEKKEAEARQFIMQAGPGRYGATRFPQSEVQGQVHPVSMVHAGSSLGGNVRHEPYPIGRPARRRSGSNNSSLMVASSPSARTVDDETIKQETEESDAVTNEGQSQTMSTSLKSLSDANDDDSNTFPGEPGTESIGEGSDVSNLIPGNNPENTESAETDANVSVKLEALTEAEMDLEITGVEPGRPMVPQDNWDPNISMAANFDPNMAVGSKSQQADSQNEHPKAFGNGEEVFKDFLNTYLLEETAEDVEKIMTEYMKDEKEKMKLDHKKKKQKPAGEELVKILQEEVKSLRKKIHELEEDNDSKLVVGKGDIRLDAEKSDVKFRAKSEYAVCTENETLDDKMLIKMSGDQARFKFLCRKFFTDEDLRNCSRTGKKSIKSGETPRPPLDATQFEKLRKEVYRFCSFEEKVFLKKFENLQKVLRKAKRNKTV